MKLAAIEPFVGTPEAEIERELAAESVRLASEKISEVEGSVTEETISEERPNTSRGGFERLADFLSKHRTSHKSHQSKKQMSLKAYRYLEEAEHNQQCRGFEVNKAA